VNGGPDGRGFTLGQGQLSDCGMERAATIGPAGVASGLTPKAIRLYEKRGLLPVAVRTTAGYRCYTGADIATLRFIRQCRTLGLTLSEIGQILRTRRTGTAPCETVRTLLNEHVTRIDRQIGALRALREQLVAASTSRAATSVVADSICSLIEQTAPSS